MLPFETFELVVESTPLVSLDFVVRGPDGRILLGLRNNCPAKGYWFVPGGRIWKGELVTVTFSRLLDVELGLRPKDVTTKPLGLYQHLYSDSFADDSASTHYVVLAYEIQLQDKPFTLPDEQHSAYKWFEREELLKCSTVHQHTKWYFIKSKQADLALNN